MPDAEDLCYHGRRSVDELVGALNAGTPKAASVHRELSRLHLDRFVVMMASATRGIDDPASSAG